jgi:hypothetical protein
MPDDVFEREADHMAERVMGMTFPSSFASPSPPSARVHSSAMQAKCVGCGEGWRSSPDDETARRMQAARMGKALAVQRKGTQEEEIWANAAAQEGAEQGAAQSLTPVQAGAARDEDQPLQTKSSDARSVGQIAPDIVHQTLLSDGAPLDAATRDFMEPRFGFDFSRVRVHTDPRASASADAIQAFAYTVGRDVVFRSGTYQPGTHTGRRLLAHELTHVVQQGAAAAATGSTHSAGGSPPAAVARAPVTPAWIPAVQRAPTTAISGGAPASIPLGACTWGMTFPESTTVTASAVKSGASWQADPTALVGNYSQRTRLLPSETEVTGPGGNTIEGNHCAQVKELKALGFCPGTWYMLAAVVAHENVHLAHFLPALNTVCPAVTADFNALTIPDAPGKTAATATTELKALPAYAATVPKAYSRWLGEAAKLVAPDHSGPAAATEHTVVDPMVSKICAHAKTSKWAACADCP